MARTRTGRLTRAARLTPVEHLIRWTASPARADAITLAATSRAPATPASRRDTGRYDAISLRPTAPNCSLTGAGAVLVRVEAVARDDSGQCRRRGIGLLQSLWWTSVSRRLAPTAPHRPRRQSDPRRRWLSLAQGKGRSSETSCWWSRAVLCNRLRETPEIPRKDQPARLLRCTSARRPPPINRATAGSRSLPRNTAARCRPPSGSAADRLGGR
jgi:hypothetical protein